MKYIILLVLILAPLTADKVTIGAGPYVQSQPYPDVDDLVLASPVIFFDNEIIYIRWSRAGVYFLGESKEDYGWGFSLTTQPRTYQYKAENSKILTGMSEKKSTWEAGLAFSAKSGNAYIEMMALTDILNRYESWIFKTEAGYDFELGNFSLYPSLILVYQSSDFINYYYGVSEEDSITSTHNKYIADAGMQIGVQTYIKYPLSDKLSTLINLRIDRLSDEATASPIVKDNYIYSGLLSLIYTFEY